MYRFIIKPLLFLLPAEAAHRLAFGVLRLVHALPFGAALLSRLFAFRRRELAMQVFGLRFESPVLLAAGFDKNATGYEALASLGFGAIEVGTVTHEAQAGNPRPRLFRLPRDRALLNRMGFNNDGAAAVAARTRKPRQVPLGVNIGKTKRVSEAGAIEDYVGSTQLLGPHADYLVVNVSSPNTPGLRDLQSVAKLRPLLAAVQQALRAAEPAREVPLLVKIAPDLTDQEIVEIADLAIELGIAGIIATNTTLSRSGLTTPARVVGELGAGGVSGAPLKARALEVLRLLRARAGARLTLIAAGGIESVDDAWQRLAAGASLVQIYTGFVYEGPALPGRLAHGLLERARAQGFEDLASAVAQLHARLAEGGGP